MGTVGSTTEADIMGMEAQVAKPLDESVFTAEEQAATAGEDEDGFYFGLASLPPKTLVTEDGLAKLLGKGCRETIKRAVERGELPRPIRLMGKNTWTVDVIIHHIEDQLAAEARKFARVNR